MLYDFADVAGAPELTADTYVPRASTPLLDAMGRGMNGLSERLSGLDTADRPEHILFVVITDGLENASNEFRRADIVKMIGERKSIGWQFVFLSADLDAVAEAADLGIMRMQRMAFKKSADGVEAASALLADHVVAMREGKSLRFEFTAEELAAQETESNGIV